MNFTYENNGIKEKAYFSDKNIHEIFLPLLQQLSLLQKEKDRRIIVYLAAPPGAGKTTLVELFKRLVNNNHELASFQFLGMDGFHHYQDYLLSHTTIRNNQEILLKDIKGAPITFDLVKLENRIKELTIKDEVSWPSYSRVLHNPIEDSINVKEKIIMIEGNYLLLNIDGWNKLKDYADYTIKINAPMELLKERLIKRKLDTGRDYQKALEFVENVDLENARLVLENSFDANTAWELDRDNNFR